jgi:hypothetical protein
MAIRDVFKISRKTFFNPRAWFNYDEFKNQNRILWGTLSTVIIPPTPAPITDETFEQAMARNGMTETDREEGVKAYRRFALLFVFLALIAFIYAFFLLFAYHVMSGWLLALCVCALLLSQAFKYDFWSLQLRRRNLRLTFNDWKEAMLGNKGGAA